MRPPEKHRDPLKAGIYRSLRLPGAFVIDPVKWARAAQDGDLVGECRRPGCRGFLVVDDDKPAPGDSTQARIDYTARCLYCDAEVVAPGGRTLFSSARHLEAPAFWAGRAAHIRPGNGNGYTNGNGRGAAT
jgi:hypothetical protein